MKELWGRDENTRVGSTCFGSCLWDKYQALDPTVAVVPSRVGTKQPICRRNLFSIQRDVQSFTLSRLTFCHRPSVPICSLLNSLNRPSQASIYVKLLRCFFDGEAAPVSRSNSGSGKRSHCRFSKKECSVAGRAVVIASGPVVEMAKLFLRAVVLNQQRDRFAGQDVVVPQSCHRCADRSCTLRAHQWCKGENSQQ